MKLIIIVINYKFFIDYKLDLLLAKIIPFIYVKLKLIKTHKFCIIINEYK